MMKQQMTHEMLRFANFYVSVCEHDSRPLDRFMITSNDAYYHIIGGINAPNYLDRWKEHGFLESPREIGGTFIWHLTELGKSVILMNEI